MIPQELRQIFEDAARRLFNSKTDPFEKAGSLGAIMGLQDSLLQAMELPPGAPEYISPEQVRSMTAGYLEMQKTVKGLEPKVRLLTVAMFMILDGNRAMHDTISEINQDKSERLKHNHRSKAADDGVNYSQN